MDIAALATGLSQGQLCNTASILVMKKVMDTSAEQSQDFFAAHVYYSSPCVAGSSRQQH